jgi:hypothetical protein
MGSFDIACSVSGISLFGSQPVKLFFILPNCWRGEWDNHIGPNEMYRFCSFGIDATYYDYGQYDIDIEQPNWKEFVKFIRENAVCIEQGENRYHEKAFDPGNSEHMKQEYLLENLTKGRVLIKCSCTGKDLQVSHYPIHKDVYDEILMADVSTWNGESSRVFFERQAAKQLCSELDPMTRALFITGDMIYGGKSFHPGYKFSSYDNKYGADALMGNIIDVSMMILWLEEVRKQVVPSMYAGQDPHYEEVIEFHAKCADIATRLKEKMEEYDG